MKKVNKTVFWIMYHAILVLISLGIAMKMKYEQLGKALSSHTIVPFLTIFVMSATIGYIANFIISRSKSMSHKQLTKWIIPGIILFYILAFLIANISITLGVLGAFIVKGRELNGFFTHLFKYELSPPDGGILSGVLIFVILFFYILWQRSGKKEQSLIQEKLKFQYTNLKSQVNPHFLFNSLNTLSELVHENANKADTYIQKLSEMYRYVLENEDIDMVPLAEELLFVQNYFELQRYRDLEKVQLQIDIDDPENYQVIPVSVQSLVENAFKHNMSSKESPLKIKISLINGKVQVSNNLQRKKILESSKTGLSNLKRRVSLMLNEDVTISENKNNFTVELPIKKI